MKVLIEPGIGEYEEKKSRFIATVAKVSSEEEAIAFVNEMKKKYWDARHNCMAYIIGEKREIMRFSDDGEPQGTAGKPILDVLIGSKATNIAIVVTRYFGGVLLGTGGLVRAYQKSSQDAIANSVLADKCRGYSVTICTDYNGFGKIQYLAATEGVDIMDTEYTDVVTITVVAEEEPYHKFKSKAIESTAGKALFEEEEKVEFYKTQSGVTIC